jgi:hypothetical protein
VSCWHCQARPPANSIVDIADRWDHVLDPNQARTLLKICASARERHFRVQGSGKIVKAVSVGRIDEHRPAVVAILKDQEPLWTSRGSFSYGMALWVSARTWYPFEMYTDATQP